jgi:D-alanine-D-alanine ligase
MRITVLTYVEEEGSKEEPDIVVPQVAGALRKKGHEVAIIKAHGDVAKLVADLQRTKPDVVFNLLEMFANDLFLEVPAVGLLDLLGLPHTGGGPGEFYLAQDKALAKKLLAYESIPYPRFAVFAKDRGLETGGNLRMPLFVKPLCADASIGIDAKALVNDSSALMKRVLRIHEELGDAALAEEYIDGREFYVGVLGNSDPIAFPPIEMDFSGLPPGTPKVLDRAAKWSPDSAMYKGTKAIIPELPDELRAKIQKVATEAYRALRVRDYGRVDLRMAETGDVYVIEVNPSCYLEESSEFAMAAKAAGIEHGDLVEKIVQLSLERFRKRAGFRGPSAK